MHKFFGLVLVSALLTPSIGWTAASANPVGMSGAAVSLHHTRSTEEAWERSGSGLLGRVHLSALDFVFEMIASEELLRSLPVRFGDYLAANLGMGVGQSAGSSDSWFLFELAWGGQVAYAFSPDVELLARFYVITGQDTANFASRNSGGDQRVWRVVALGARYRNLSVLIDVPVDLRMVDGTSRPDRWVEVTAKWYLAPTERFEFNTYLAARGQMSGFADPNHTPTDRYSQSFGLLFGFDY